MKVIKPLSDEQREFLDLIENWFGKNENEQQLSAEIQTLFKKRINYTYNLYGGADPIFKYINDFNQAIAFLLESINQGIINNIKAHERNLTERQNMVKFFDQLEEWINSNEVKSRYNYIRHQNIIKKLKQYRDTDLLGSPLSDYIGNFEEAKKFITEIFYPKQERFYSELESWAESEIEDKECSVWICDYLWQGRRNRIYKIKVFKFLKDIDKAKEFLLYQYQEKLNWDKFKSEKRRIRQEIIDRKSIKRDENFDKRLKKYLELKLNLLYQNSELKGV